MNLVIDFGLKEALKLELARLNEALKEKAQNTDKFLGDLLSYVLIGSGKRVRPALVFLTSELGTSEIKEARIVAESIELIHVATLIHDDVIDKAALRRGRKTVAEEHGVDTAVLLGDHIYTYAFECVAALGIPEILRLMARSTSVMCQGEIDQLKCRYQFDLTEEAYFSFINKKTASLFGTAARAGAILSGQDLPVQTVLESYAVNLGMAFQVTDDLLDLTGDESVVGKTLRIDLNNGKMTLPLIHFRNQLTNEGEKKDFLSNLHSLNGHISLLVDRMKAAGSLSYAETIASRYVQKALEQLAALPAGKTRRHLTSLAEMLLERNA